MDQGFGQKVLKTKKDFYKTEQAANMPISTYHIVAMETKSCQSTYRI